MGDLMTPYLAVEQSGIFDSSTADILQTAIKRKQYWLLAHLRLCVTLTGAVLLDLKRNRYFGLGRNEIHALCTLACNCPSFAVSNELISAATIPQTAQALLEAGLLSCDEPTDLGPISSSIDLSGTMTSVGYEI